VQSAGEKPMKKTKKMRWRGNSFFNAKWINGIAGLR